MKNNNVKSPLTLFKVTFYLLILIIFSGCGGGSSNESNAPIDNVPASIVVSHHDVLVNGTGGTAQLNAYAVNSAGQKLDDEITWLSDNQTIVTVDETGQLTGLVTNGNASVTASISDITSSPVRVTIATLASGAMVLDSSQIIGDVTLKNQALSPSDTNPFHVVVSKNFAVSVGDKIVGTAPSYVGGEVVSIEDNINDKILTLKALPVADLFEDLQINETVKIENLQEFVSPEIAEKYNIETKEDGSIVFNIKPGTNNKPVTLNPGTTRSKVSSRAENDGVETLDLGIMACLYKTELGVQPITLNVTPDHIVINPDLDLIFEYDEDNGGLKKIAVDGTLDAGFYYDIGLQANFDGFIECEQELFVIEPSLPGVFDTIIGVAIPVSVGFRIDGKTQVHAANLKTSANVISTATAGVQCNESGCSSILTGDSNAHADFDIKMAGLEQAAESLRLQVKYMPYTTIGFRLFGFNFTSYRGGISETHNLAPFAAQIAAQHNGEDYMSDYFLAKETGFIPGQSHNLVWDYLKTMGLAEFDAPVDVENQITQTVLSRSPSASRFLVNRVLKPDWDPELRFNLSLVPTSENYIQLPASATGNSEFFNLDEVIIYRVNDFDNIYGDMTEVARQKIEEGQTEIEINLLLDTMEDDRPVGGKYYAFVTTNTGLDFSGENESGQIESHKMEYLVAQSHTQDPLIITKLKGSASTTNRNIEIKIERDLGDGFFEPATDIVVNYLADSNEMLETKTNELGVVEISFNVPIGNKVGPASVSMALFIEWIQENFYLGDVDYGSSGGGGGPL